MKNKTVEVVYTHNTTNKKENRNFNIDLIKVVSAIGVISLHTFGHNRNYNSIVYYLSSISVLLFFMINGYLLIKKDSITYRYIAKKY